MTNTIIPNLTPIASSFFARLASYNADWFATPEACGLIIRMYKRVAEREGRESARQFAQRVLILENQGVRK